MRLDLADLRLFLSVVDAGSITQGATLAHLALASASERLRHMEADVGVPLLQRLPRGVRPTPAGEALAHHARHILRQQAALRRELQAHAQGLHGRIHLWVNTASLTEFLPIRLAPWLAERPQMHVDLHERGSTDIVRNVAAGLADAGLVSSAVPMAGLQCHVLAQDPLVLLAAPQHPVAQQRSVALHEVLAQPFVGLSAGNALYEHVLAQAREAGGELQTRVRLANFDGVAELVAHGIGLGVVPKTVASRLRKRHRLAVLPLRDAWAQRALCACFRNWADLPLPLQSLLRHLGVPAAADEGRA